MRRKNLAGRYTIAIIVVVLLFLLIWKGSYILKLNVKSNFYFFTISVLSDLMVIATSKYI